ncbi:Poly(A) RNA polymerase cid11 [Babesia microti strain RI]|uniref:Poly(A) RNA polymerase cid11 n=1 Tax=Babesia microti (strain RI) TaxID=1133968 RepID=A0A1R4ACB2_BABMR|nr:Poly(A) RNA polymerase cid11 [Babesia microti strain RI]SJK86659.1 Poly(A) RNA polymerase cid11 [Babesia microti strain RI]|eukprot:XP_021338789.1 Poly(A) RNA polymerase cid11 [Babesia microti strain RI]
MPILLSGNTTHISRKIITKCESIGHSCCFSVESTNLVSNKVLKAPRSWSNNLASTIPHGEYRKWLNKMLLILHAKNATSFWCTEKLKLLEFSLATYKISTLTRNNYFNQLLHHLDKTKGSLLAGDNTKYINICKNISTNKDNSRDSDDEQSRSQYFSMLDSEIRGLHFQLSPTLAQYENKNNLIKALVPILEGKTKGKFYPFGSCESGFWVRGSDVDACLVIPGCDTRSQWLHKLRLIKRALSSVPGISFIRIIHANVPIAKIFNEENANVCDISINNTVALENTLFVKVLNKIDYRTSQLGRIIKYWASCRKINNRAQGTMSSYTLLLMLFHFLQNRKPPILPKYMDIKKDDSRPYIIPDDNNNNESMLAESPDHDQEMDEIEDLDEEQPREPSTEDDLIGNIKNPPFLDNLNEILERNQFLGTNSESLGELLYHFFEFFGDEQFEQGRTIDIHNNTVDTNNKEVLIVRCPLTGKNVNPFSPRIWQSIHGEFRRMKILLQSQNCLAIMCEVVSDPPLKREVKEKIAKRKEMKKLAEEIESLTL